MLELSHALSLQKRNIQCCMVFIKISKKKKRFNGGHLGFHDGRYRDIKLKMCPVLVELTKFVFIR